MRWVISLLVAVLVGYSLSIVINASVSAATLVGFGIEVSLSDRLDMIAKEWVGLGTIYLPLYLILHAICFWLLGLVLRNRAVTTVIARATYAGVGALSLMTFYLSFDAVMGSFGLPKSTDDEKDARRTAIRSAMMTAASVPFETATLAMNLLQGLPELARLGNANAVTDVGVAGLLASAAAKGAVFNVEINLQSLPDDYAIEMRTALPQMKESIRAASREVMDAVRDRMDE